LISSKKTIIIPLTAAVARLDGTQDVYEAIMILKFNNFGKIVHWQEVYHVHS
jgi:hypothetical protein